jgi:hypothetical protein
MTKDIFVIRVVYKCGYTHDFPAYSFSTDGDKFSWESADVQNRPLKFGADDIAAIWQVGFTKGKA